MFRLAVFYVGWLLSLGCFSQQQAEIDSLQKQLNIVKEDTAKISLLLSICERYCSSHPNKAIDYARQALALSERAQYKQGQCESLFLEGFAYFQKSEYPAALRAYEEALSIARQHHLTENALNILLNIGVVHDLRSENDKAFEIYQQVLEQSTATGHQRLAASAQQNIAILHTKKGEYEEALKMFIDILPLFEALDAKTDKAKTLLNIGILYSMRHDHDNALAFMQQSLELWKQLDDQPGIARILYNLGATYQNLGHHRKAAQYYTEALEMQKALGNHRGIAYNLNSLAALYSDAGDYARAIDFFNQSNRLFYAMGLAEETASCHNNLGLALRKMGRPQQALENFMQALDIQDELENPPGKANALHHIGIVYLEDKSLKKAAYYLKQAYAINQQLGNQKEKAKNLFAMGQLYEAQHLSQQALSYYEEAASAYTAVYPDSKYFKLAQVFDKISQYYLSRNDLEQAQRYNQKAIAALLPADCDVPETCWHNTLNAIELLKTLATKASVLNASYTTHPDNLVALEASLHTYAIGLDLIDSLRSNFRTESQRALMENAADVFESSLKVLNNLYKATHEEQWVSQAFSVMERYRNHLLSEVLIRKGHLQYAGVPDSLQEKEHTLKAEIAFYQEKLLNEKSVSSPPDQEKVSFLSRKLFEKTNAYDTILTRLKNSYPSYYQLKHQSPLASVHQIQQELLQEDQALLEYFTGQEAIYLMAVNRNELVFERVEYDSALQNMLTGLTARFRALNRSQRNNSFQDYTTRAYGVYQKLIAPVYSTIENKNLLIIPDGILGYLPFETLISQNPENTHGYKDLHYLIKDYEISYHYSASLLAFEQPQQQYPPNTFIGFAPAFRDDTQQQLLVFNETVRAYIDSARALPYAEEEVKTIAALLGGNAYTGALATEQSFKQDAATYNIIHLASHSLVDDTDPLYSKLIFDSENDSIEDGLLHTYELYNMQLNADLVTLSACNTGVGKYYKGEGIVSLARGFMYAGVPNVMMSLWSVADRPTRDIMQYFYEELDQGTPYHSALHNAKLRYLQKADNLTADPYYWGAFIYLGQPLDHSGHVAGKTGWITGFLLMIMLIAGAWIFIKRKTIPL